MLSHTTNKQTNKLLRRKEVYLNIVYVKNYVYAKSKKIGTYVHTDVSMRNLSSWPSNNLTFAYTLLFLLPDTCQQLTYFKYIILHILLYLLKFLRNHQQNSTSNVFSSTLQTNTNNTCGLLLLLNNLSFYGFIFHYVYKYSVGWVMMTCFIISFGLHVAVKSCSHHHTTFSVFNFLKLILSELNNF